jgi:hypothetical protein
LLYADTELWSAVAGELDNLIPVLSGLRARVASGPGAGDGASVAAAVDTIISFLERARQDDLFKVAWPQSPGHRRKDAGDAPIPSNLSNEEIRSLLRRDLSKAQLAELARQRSIPVGKNSKAELRSAILSFIEKQESYARLHA